MRIELEHVSQSFLGKKRRLACVLDSIDLEIKSGELLTLIGPSGAGKSTLLRLMAGLEKPTKGAVLLDGQNVLDVPPPQRSIAILFQDAPLFPGLSGRENLAMSLKRKGLTGGQLDRELDGVAKRFGILSCLAAYPEELSVGERRRVALARALVGDPSVLLLDEPLTGLDPELRYSLKEEVLAWREQSRATVVCVTHDPVDGLTMGDRVAVIEQGRLLQLGTSEELYQRPSNRFVAGFVGYPPMNFIPGTIDDTGSRVSIFAGNGTREAVSIPVDGMSMSEARPGREVIMGVRPEDLLASDGQVSGPSLLEGNLIRSERFLDQTSQVVDCQGLRLTVAGENEVQFEPARRVTIYLRDVDRCHWFDGTTSHRIPNDE